MENRKYIIVENRDIATFAAEVNKWIGLGYEPYGYLSVTPGMSNGSSTFSFTYTQAMMKK